MTGLSAGIDMENFIILDEEQKLAFLRAFAKMASVDGKFDESEESFIKGVAISLGISVEKSETALANLDEDKIVEDVAKINNRSVALELIKELCMLAHADEKLSDEEVVFIGKVGLAMGVELEKIEQISNWVIDRLILLDQEKIIFEKIKKIGG